MKVLRCVIAGLMCWGLSLSVQAYVEETPTFTEVEEVRYYTADLLRVVDADTFDVRLSMGLGVLMDVRLRIKDYDAPETWRPDTQAELAHGEAATEFAIELLPERFIVRSYGWAVYNRVEADVIFADGRNYSAIMVEQGFVKYDEYVDVH